MVDTAVETGYCVLELLRMLMQIYRRKALLVQAPNIQALDYPAVAAPSVSLNSLSVFAVVPSETAETDFHHHHCQNSAGVLRRATIAVSGASQR